MATKTGILVVDDDPHFTKTLCDILKVKGYKTAAATTGKAALGIVKGQAPAVALIDLKLEDISGLEVMKRIGKYCPNTECIVLTGHASQESAIEAVNLGAYSYVQKPYRVDELMVTIRRAIEKQEAEQKLRQSEERYRNTLDNMLEGCQIIGYDWRYRYVNDAVARHGRTTKEKLLGKTMMQVYPGIEKTKVFAALQRCMQERISIHMENEFEFPSGEKGWFELSIQPVPEGVFVLSVDITERKQAEEERRQSFEKSQRSLRATVDALASAVGQRDPYTADHQRRVTQLSTAIARGMGLPDEPVECIRMAGMVHDIGKIHVPAEILSKPSKLTETEFSLIKTHPQVAYDILKGVEFPWPVAQVVLQHHERLDGSGYPQGLSDNDIILEARILAVADVVEAMASHRPYRPALGVAKALREIKEKSGVLYDPDVAACCSRLFAREGFKFEQGDIVRGATGYGSPRSKRQPGLALSPGDRAEGYSKSSAYRTVHHLTA